MKESRKVLLDTNFILTCVKQKIDFFEDLQLRGFSIIIPLEVIKELKKIAESKKKIRFKEAAELSLKLLKINENLFKKIDLGGKKTTDKLIIDYSREHPDIAVATLDREIKEFLKNKKVVIRGKKRLEMI